MDGLVWLVNGVSATVAEAVLAGSATLAAITVTVVAFGIAGVAGAVPVFAIIVRSPEPAVTFAVAGEYAAGVPT